MHKEVPLTLRVRGMTHLTRGKKREKSFPLVSYVAPSFRSERSERRNLPSPTQYRHTLSSRESHACTGQTESRTRKGTTQRDTQLHTPVRGYREATSAGHWAAPNHKCRIT